MRTILQERVTTHWIIVIWYTNSHLCVGLDKSEVKKEVIDEARRKGAKVHFASLMDIVEDDFGSNAVFAEQGSSASQMTAAKIMDIISRLPGCAGQAGNAVSACTQVEMEDAPKLFQNSQIAMSRHLDSSTTTKMA